MRLVRKYRIYSCISRKIMYQLLTLKVGVRLTHALRGSVLGGLCKHIPTRAAVADWATVRAPTL